MKFEWQDMFLYNGKCFLWWLFCTLSEGICMERFVLSGEYMRKFLGNNDEI